MKIFRSPGKERVTGGGADRQTKQTREAAELVSSLFMVVLQTASSGGCFTSRSQNSKAGHLEKLSNINGPMRNSGSA